MKTHSLKFRDSSFSKREWQMLFRLNTPAKIQDFLNNLPFNHEVRGETYQSVKCTLQSKRAHCFEGALLAAAALWVHGEPPLLLDLVSSSDDDDHVVTLFKRGKFWGAISKTNHPVLRYREPIYHDVRELALSYFHEYFLPDGTKTLRLYSKPFDLSKVKEDWLAGEEDLFDLVNRLHHSPHEKMLTASQVRGLRKADKLEIDAQDVQEYPSKSKRH